MVAKRCSLRPGTYRLTYWRVPSSIRHTSPPHKASSVTLSQMVCDVSALHIGYILAADQFSVFVHMYRKNKWNENKILSFLCTKIDNWSATGM